MLPFQHLPGRLVVELVMGQVYWLNSFPASNSLSDCLSPRNIITGVDIDYNKHCVLEFGTYVQTHKERDNTMTPGTEGAIALQPIINAQGRWYFK
jgi:hypothetical protein